MIEIAFNNFIQEDTLILGIDIHNGGSHFGIWFNFLFFGVGIIIS